MKILDVVQGSPEWLAARTQYHPASDAPAMMGVSKYKTRSDLVCETATGITPEIDAATQARFDRGHETEALARAIVEEMIGEDLFPAVGTDDEGYLLASFDGITMDGTTGYEHKLWNETLAAQVRAGELPPAYYWQLEQQIAVGGLERVIFVCSDGTRDNFVSTEYRAVPGRASELRAGWEQFDKDVAAYVPTEAVAAPVAAPIKELPALTIQISGSVTASNLREWKEIVTERIQEIKTDLQSDQDFFDAAKMVTFLDEGEKRIDMVKSQAQAQATSIDEVFRALDEIRETMRSKRLELDKLVTKRKEEIKVEIVQAAKLALAEHVAALNTRLGKPYMPVITADFGAAIKGKRTVQSLKDAADTLLAAKKVEANQISNRITWNLTTLTEDGDGFDFLFADKDQLVLKDPDAVEAIVKQRIGEHKAAEEKRLEAERQRIAEEERKKLEAQQAEQRRQEEAAAAHAAKIEADRLAQQNTTPAVAGTLLPDSSSANEGTGETPAPGQRETPRAPLDLPPSFRSAAEAQRITPADNDDGRRITVGAISNALGFNLTATFLEHLGFIPVTQERSAKLYRHSDFVAICDKLIFHINAVKLGGLVSSTREAA